MNTLVATHRHLNAPIALLPLTLLVEGSVSCWHRVRSDEVWHFYEGDSLELVTARPAFDVVERWRLGGQSGDAAPVHVVPAGHWQAARTTGGYTRVGCRVGPGFEFDDFTMLRDDPARAARIRHERADVSHFI